MEDVALQKRRAQRSPTPTKRKRSPHSPPHCKSTREEKNSKKKKERKRSASSPSSSPSSSSDESGGYSSKESPRRRLRRSHAAWRRSNKFKKFKEGGKSISFLTYDGTFGATDKVLAFIQQFDAAFGDEGFIESSKLCHVAMHFQKSARQWWACLQAYGEAPKTWKNLRGSIMKQFLASDAKDKVLPKWKCLKLTPYEYIYKYVDKFWDLHLKATVYKKIDFEEQKQQFCAGIPEDMNDPQQGDLSTVSNNDTLSSPTIPKVNPQTEWEEAEHSLNPIAQVQAPVLPVQPHQSPVAPPNPTPQRPVPAWSLGRKTNSLLFPKSPNPLFPGKNIFKRGLLLQPSLSPASSVAEPLAGDVFPHQGSSGSLKQPLPSSTTTPEEEYPDSPVEPLKQPVLLGRPSTPGSMSKLKTRSLKEIYDRSNLAILFDSEVQPPAMPNFIAPTSSTNLKVADAFVLQVLHASMNAPFDPGALNSSAEIVDGITVTEAFAGSEADLWQHAMDSEYQSLIDNGTWELVSPPPNRKIVTCKWLLRKKLHADGSVSRYKARLVARGFSQVPGMDYSETFSPVLRITSFRVLIAIAAQFRLLLHQMDVRTAFLHGDLEEEIYMMQPPRYISKEHPDHVCKLIKSLYGLKQSPRQWYRRFHECMTSLGYARFTSEPNIYSRHSPDVFLLLAIYVDDILLLCNSESALATAKKELSSSFSMTDMGLLPFCLGIQVFQDALQGLIKISQQSYIGSLLKKYDMEACKGVDTPLPANLKIKKIDDSDSILTVQPFPYANILGGVRYLIEWSYGMLVSHGFILLEGGKVDP
ncbi:hypothetical protein L7F22_058089 [Adiantum nelumboides]|nr:hypothetical protein [Adiantum nelumboides]